MSGLYDIGTSALLSYQRALATTGHNISNANTEGYTRQTVEFGTRPAQASGAGYTGKGVQVNNIERQYDSFLSDQVRVHTSEHSSVDQYYKLSREMDNLLADPKAGLTPALEDFFGAVQDVSNDPSSTAARQSMMAQGEAISSRFHFLDGRLTELQDRINRQMQTTADEINQYAQSIADLNEEIVRAKGVAGGKPPNDLLDRRDLLVNKLSERVNVTTVDQDDGSINVFIGSGQALVLRYESTQMTVGADEYESTQRRILLEGQDMTGAMQGGTLGGVLDFQDEILDPMRKSLGRIAVAVSESFNDQHKLGMDLNNQMGGDFFTDLTQVAAQPSAKNDSATDYDFQATITDETQLTTSDYKLEYDGGTATYSLTRMSDNTTIFSGEPAGNFPVATGEGFQVELSAGTSITDSDSWMIRPTFNSSANMGMALDKPKEIAAAAPLRGHAATSNLGTAEMTDPVIESTTQLPPNFPMGGDIQLTYDATNTEYTVAAPGGWTVAPDPVPYDPATDSGQTQTVTLTNGGEDVTISFTIEGEPQDGDTLSIADNTDASGDNRNALDLIDLQTKGIIDGGDADYQGAYAGMVADVGTKAYLAEQNASVQKTLLDNAIEEFEGVSGVNMDEEAAKLLQYQQAYVAAAKYVSTVDELFNTLLNSV